jgi:hypothetical protein
VGVRERERVPPASLLRLLSKLLAAVAASCKVRVVLFCGGRGNKWIGK